MIIIFRIIISFYLITSLSGCFYIEYFVDLDQYVVDEEAEKQYENRQKNIFIYKPFVGNIENKDSLIILEINNLHFNKIETFDEGEVIIDNFTSHDYIRKTKWYKVKIHQANVFKAYMINWETENALRYLNGLNDTILIEKEIENPYITLDKEMLKLSQNGITIINPYNSRIKKRTDKYGFIHIKFYLNIFRKELNKAKNYGWHKLRNHAVRYNVQN